jgi:hypothetical protein
MLARAKQVFLCRKQNRPMSVIDQKVSDRSDEVLLLLARLCIDVRVQYKRTGISLRQ